MMETIRRAGLIASIALIATAACGKNAARSGAMDDGLKADLEEAGASGLELAPKAGRQVVVSAIEGGPRATPATAPRRAPQPVQHASQPRTRAQRTTVASRVPVRQPVVSQAPTAPTPSPGPQPQAQQRQPGVYSTEADVFRQMPWIRP